MTKKYFILIPVVAAAAFMMTMFIVNFSENKQGSEVNQNNDNSQINNAVFPLYEGPMWGKPAFINDETGEYWRIVSGTISDVENIYELTGPFTEYYDQKLTSSGWVNDINREASGPGSNISYYEKNGEFITISYSSDFKIDNENAPSECPCDVNFTITSGQIN